MSDVEVSPGWYTDPSGRHGQRWWDGRQWTEHVADGQAVATDPPPEEPAHDDGEVAAASGPSDDVAQQQRAALEAAVRASDHDELPKGWPARYEPVIAEVLAMLDPAEAIEAAWRMRTMGPRQRVSDIGLLVVTDRRVVAADRSAKTSGSFAFPHSDVTTVALVHRKMGSSDFGFEIRLLGREGTLLGDDESPAEFQVFGQGRDPSKWDTHPQGEDDLREVQRALLELLPGATEARTQVDVSAGDEPAEAHADHLDHPPPTAVTTTTSAATAVSPGAETTAATTDESSAPMSLGSAIGSLLVGIVILAVATFFIGDMLTSDCERDGIAMTCESRGGSVVVETEYNLLLIGVGTLFGLGSLLRGVLGLVDNVRHRRRPSPTTEGRSPGWYSDPTAAHQHRYWDGTDWSDHVADDGVTAEDAIPADPVAASTAPTNQATDRQT